MRWIKNIIIYWLHNLCMTWVKVVGITTSKQPVECTQFTPRFESKIVTIRRAASKQVEWSRSNTLRYFPIHLHSWSGNEDGLHQRNQSIIRLVPLCGQTKQDIVLIEIIHCCSLSKRMSLIIEIATIATRWVNYFALHWCISGTWFEIQTKTMLLNNEGFWLDHFCVLFYPRKIFESLINAIKTTTSCFVN